MHAYLDLAICHLSNCISNITFDVIFQLFVRCSQIAAVHDIFLPLPTFISSLSNKQAPNQTDSASKRIRRQHLDTNYKRNILVKCSMSVFLQFLMGTQRDNGHQFHGTIHWCHCYDWHYCYLLFNRPIFYLVRWGLTSCL